MNTPALTLTVDPETASILAAEVAHGRFASPADAVAEAVRDLDMRRRARAELNRIADEALADMKDLVDHEEVMASLDAVIERVAANRAA